jgi:hypothetical protein
MDQVSIKYIPTSSIARPSKLYPNLDFWPENKPSGNPARECSLLTQHYKATKGNFGFSFDSLSKKGREADQLLVG